MLGQVKLMVWTLDRCLRWSFILLLKGGNPSNSWHKVLYSFQKFLSNSISKDLDSFQPEGQGQWVSPISSWRATAPFEGIFVKAGASHEILHWSFHKPLLFNTPGRLGHEKIEAGARATVKKHLKVETSNLLGPQREMEGDQANHNLIRTKHVWIYVIYEFILSERIFQKSAICVPSLYQCCMDF